MDEPLNGITAFAQRMNEIFLSAGYNAPFEISEKYGSWETIVSDEQFTEMLEDILNTESISSNDKKFINQLKLMYELERASEWSSFHDWVATWSWTDQAFTFSDWVKWYCEENRYWSYA